MENNSSSSGISPPEAAVAQNLANVNSTSLHFLNARPPTWMTGTLRYPMAGTPPTTARLTQDNHAPPEMPPPTASATPITTLSQSNYAHPSQVPPPTTSTTHTTATLPQTNILHHSHFLPSTASTIPITNSTTMTLTQHNHAYPSTHPQLAPPPTATITPITTTLIQNNQTLPQQSPLASPLTTHTTPSPISPTSAPVQQHHTLHFSRNQPSPIADQPPPIMSPAPHTAPVIIPLKRATEAPNDDPNKRPRLPTDNAHQVSSPSLTPQPADQATYIERLHAVVEGARQQSPSKTLNAIETHRVALLSQASKEYDVFFLLLHQIHCLSFFQPPAVTRLGCGRAEKAGLATLDLLLGHNSLISPPILSCFVNFPHQADNLEEPVHAQSVDQVKNYLVSLGFKWDWLRQICLNRRFPPCWAELVYHFSISSIPTLSTLYVSLDRHISRYGDPSWESQSLNFFCESRDQYESQRHGSGFGIEQHLNNTIRIFGTQYQIMRGNFNAMQPPPPLRAQQAQTPPAAPRPVPPHHISTGAPMNPVVPSRPARGTSGAPSSRHTSRRGRAGPSSTSINFAPLILSTGNQGGRPRTAPAPWQPFPSSPAPLQPFPSTLVTPPNQTSSPVGQNGRLPLTYDPLLPPVGFQMAQASHPNPDVIALHQLQLKSPSFAMADDARGKATPTRLYAYMAEFALSPKRVSRQDNFLLWNFDLSAELLAHRPGRLPPSGVGHVPGAREYKPGCILLRLNCVKQDIGAPAPESGAFAEMATSWPAFVFVSLNETEDVELRRKAHWGRDRATDITDLVSPGRNALSLSYHPQPAEESDAFYIAVELFRVTDQGSVRDLVKTMDEATAVAAMAAPLKECHQDEEISCADLGLSIDLIDPFMARIWTTPVRGSRCRHRECFDLDAFLISRASSKEKNYYRLNDPDRWNCPICGRDARPQELVIDGFLVKVRATLEANGNLEARSIRTFLDGSWIPRIDVNDDHKQIQQQQQQPNGTVTVNTKVESTPPPAAAAAAATTTTTTTTTTTSTITHSTDLVEISDDE